MHLQRPDLFRLETQRLANVNDGLPESAQRHELGRGGVLAGGRCDVWLLQGYQRLLRSGRLLQQVFGVSVVGNQCQFDAYDEVPV